MHCNQLFISHALSFVFLFAFTACQKKELPDNRAPRTIIVYMAADNDLSGVVSTNLDQMKQGFSETGTHLIVFLDKKDESPRLLEIHPGKETLVKSYSELNSADPAVMKEIISEIIGLYPAKEYGLVLWSHATSWMPAGSTLRSFAVDSGTQMNIPELAVNLPLKFNFILFDACLMGSVEVVYELKDKAVYIIASPAETIYTGFPYDQIIPELIKSKIDFNAVAQSYFNYYNAQSGVYQSATISVVQTGNLASLAYGMNLLCKNNSVNMQSLDRKSVQRLDMYNEQYTFDLSSFVDKIFPNVNKDDFMTRLNKAVLYKYHTSRFAAEYDINTFCGLSCYIPLPGRDDLNAYYKSMKWYRDAGLNNLW